MGFIGSLFGGNSGMGWSAQGVPIKSGTNPTQIAYQYGQSQNGLDQQQAFVNALAAQNGLGNQASVFGQQQQLANQLQNLSNGVGPNPAQAQLAQATGQNIASQNALMAGQRGAGANAGLIGRQAAMQGGGLQQQAVGQAATMQAQQQLAAMNALQQQQGMMGNMANQMVGQQAQGIQGFNQASQSEQQMLLNALNSYNQNQVAMQSNINNANAGIQGQVAQGQQGLLGGLMGGIGSGFGLFKHDGGYVGKGYADGGNVMPDQSQPSSFAGRFLKGYQQSTAPAAGSPVNPMQSGMSTMSTGLGSAIGKGLGVLAGGIDKALVPLFTPAAGTSDLVSPVQAPEMMASSGGGVPGQAKVKGDSQKNDVVPAMLSPGEFVIPRHIMNSEDPIGNAVKFMQMHMGKKSGS